jgi:DNA-binding NtrC family response regulator
MISGVGVFDHDIPLPHNDCHDWQCSLSFSPGRTLYDMRDELTEALCAEALRRSQGNRTEAARLLGISRHSLYRFMKETERVGRKPTDPDE